MTEVDVVIVGTGVMGAAAARSLARAGREVLLLERFRIGHDRGSSHGPARIFRLAYPDPTYVGMARDALPLWHELESETGHRLLTSTGGLDVARREHLERHAEAMGAFGVPVEWLTGSETRERFPAVSVPPDQEVLFQADTGVIDAQAAWQAFVMSATSSGAILREQARAVSLGVVGDGVEVRTEDETIRARVAVVTAGAWARSLLGSIDIELPTRPTRETISYFRLTEPAPVLIEWTDPALYALQSGARIKAAEHRAGPETDPDSAGSPDFVSVERVTAWMRERFPGAVPEPELIETCIYTNTADESFILERHGPIVIGSACSGHGFKFAPLIGERLAALALT
jgi:sarcosine oxidase